jgi:SAM-dependent methyltransferase
MAVNLIRRSFGFKTSIDVGCGWGGIGRQLGSVLVDEIPLSADVVRGSAYDIPFPDQHFDLVICSNVLEHLRYPESALLEFRRVGHQLWLSWTPWSSPYGGHEFSPLHYFGKTSGKIHEVGRNLFVTTVDQTIRMVENSGWSIDRQYPRYYPWFGLLTKSKLLREYLTWNYVLECH